MTRLQRNLAAFCVAFLLMMVVGFAFATEPVKPPTPSQSQNSTLTQNQSQTQATSQSQGNVQTASGGAAHNSLTEKSSFLAFSTASPIPVTVEGVTLPPCWLPTASRSYVFGMYANSSRYKRNKACLADLEAARAHELEVLRLNEETVRECAAVSSEITSRGFEQCQKGDK